MTPESVARRVIREHLVEGDMRREHAALVPRHLGAAAVVAVRFARI